MPATRRSSTIQELPSSVHKLIKSSRFLHLSTCSDNTPNIALLNYNYIELPETEEQESDEFFIVSADKESQTFKNIAENPKVALLIHDWTTNKQTPGTLIPSGSPSSPSNSGGSRNNTGGSDPATTMTISQMLQNMNQAAIANNSVNLSGFAEIVRNYSTNSLYKEELLKKHPEARCFVEPDSVCVIKIRVVKAKVADASNHIKEY